VENLAKAEREAAVCRLNQTNRTALLASLNVTFSMYTAVTIQLLGVGHRGFARSSDIFGDVDILSIWISFNDAPSE